MRHRSLVFAALVAALVSHAALAQQTAASSALTVQRIYAQREFAGASIPTIAWMKDGRSYVDQRPAANGGVDIVRVDVATGRTTVLAPATALVGDDGKPIAIEDLQLSADESRALLFHNSVRVWRQNTRGVYHVVDFATGKLTAVSARPGLQMFAKFSPDGRRVAFVRGNDLWVSDLAGGEERLTSDGSESIINGTTDWVYEEELDLRDAFRWSPDGRAIAFWRFDQSAIPVFPLENDLGVYPTVSALRYPKAGAPNSAVRLGVVRLGGGTPAAPTWLDVGSGSDQYLARMEWVGNDSLVVQRMPRTQTTLEVLMASGSTGRTRRVLVERDSAYVDVGDGDLHWLTGGKRFLWLSDRSGWRQLYLYDRAGSVVRQVTADGMDVVSITAVDERGGQVWVTAAAPTPMERNVYRCPLASAGACVRVTTAPGTHDLSIAPSADDASPRYAVDIHSTLNTPYTVTAYDLPSMTRRRAIEDNAGLAARLGSLGTAPARFVRIPMPDGTQLDGWRIVPPGFDSTRKYPVLMFVYGGPTAPTVSDAWGGSTYMWHQMLAQHGYVVVSVDNRGAAWRGRAFRKAQALHLGMRESQDQMDAARWIGRQSWGDAARIGIWGWSYGGYMTALTAGRGGALFKAALCVAPVTDWRLYDSIYTERYMRTPDENPDGYRTSSAQAYVDGLTARFLLVHGTGDDNVHVQNSLQLANRLEGAGKLFYMLLYPNRTHSISEGGITPQLRESFTRFLLENL